MTLKFLLLILIASLSTFCGNSSKSTAVNKDCYCDNNNYTDICIKIIYDTISIKDKISDSLFVNFEYSFKRDIIVLIQGSNTVYHSAITTDDKIGLADSFFLRKVKSANKFEAIEVHFNHSRPITINNYSGYNYLSQITH